MKITLENTTKIVDLVTPHGTVPARIWIGFTEDSGIPVHAYVTLLAVRDNEDLTQFQQELQECRVPTPEVEAIPGRMVL